MMASINYLESMYSFVDIAQSMAQVLYKVEAGHQQRSLKRGDNEINLVRAAIQSSVSYFSYRIDCCQCLDCAIKSYLIRQLYLETKI